MVNQLAHDHTTSEQEPRFYCLTLVPTHFVVINITWYGLFLFSLAQKLLKTASFIVCFG